MSKAKKGKVVSYNKWGYIFLIPFIVVYVTFQLVPLFNTIYWSFFEYYRDGMTQIGPNLVGFSNYIQLFTSTDPNVPTIFDYTWNTLIMWIMGFVPQIVVLPNHIKKFINATIVLTDNVLYKNLKGSSKIPNCINIELIGPPSENNVKNNIAIAEAMIKFGK